MKEHYTIKLKPDAKPYALFTPRHIPIPLRSEVRNERRNWESSQKLNSQHPGVQEWSWYSKVRICVDLKPRNENVLREVHPLPKV